VAVALQVYHWPMWTLPAVAPDANPATGGPGSVWVVTNTDAYGPGPGAALQHTRDFGATFQPVGNFTILNSNSNEGWPYPVLAAHAAGHIALVALGPGDIAPHVWATLDSGATWVVVDDAAAGQYVTPGVTGLEWDAQEPSVLYVSTNGRSVIAVRLAQ
jgi:photosystem II stability/assembly factor-like uncharacterized protein